MSSFTLLGWNGTSAVSTGFMMIKGSVAITVLIFVSLGSDNSQTLKDFTGPQHVTFRRDQNPVPRWGQTDIVWPKLHSALDADVKPSHGLEQGFRADSNSSAWTRQVHSLMWALLLSVVGLVLCVKLFWTKKNFFFTNKTPVLSRMDYKHSSQIPLQLGRSMWPVLANEM